ncbi:DUF1345 domain-containing protein [Variovorax sp. PAMC 28711]|uniref:DUF1345 domain-containing protein n=1 Tax=Variovorax sp. PAMC 28711 TaxID=1795631 RepID=UPI00078BAF5F|nr:DUF1345 domain-containing protein [Variovorax sp. PAMC 28711]AMM23498.1 hypothetical protein AX767_03350 [Variovorax sp. PAMC 28711]
MRLDISSTQGPQRLLYGAGAGVLAGVLAYPLDGLARGLFGWCCAVVVYLLLVWRLAMTCDAKRVRARAQALDQPNMLILFAMLVAIGVSVVVIGMLLRQVKDMGDLDRALHIGLGVVSLAGSWLLIHTLFTFHYAHRYYQAEKSADSSKQAGLDFPGTEDPDYFDFLYYSYVVGMTSQVSDVQVTSRQMRRLTLLHGVLAFAFNMVVLALSINVVASAI